MTHPGLAVPAVVPDGRVPGGNTHTACARAAGPAMTRPSMLGKAARKSALCCRTKQTARKSAPTATKSTGGKAPQRQILARKSTGVKVWVQEGGRGRVAGRATLGQTSRARRGKA